MYLGIYGRSCLFPSSLVIILAKFSHNLGVNRVEHNLIDRDLVLVHIAPI